jgi:hypothetical protein
VSESLHGRLHPAAGVGSTDRRHGSVAARRGRTTVIRSVGVLVPTRGTDSEFQRRLQTLTDAPQQYGWTDGRNISVDIPWAGLVRKKSSRPPAA